MTLTPGKFTGQNVNYARSHMGQDVTLCVPFHEGIGDPQDVGPKAFESNGTTSATWVGAPAGNAMELAGTSSSQGITFKDPTSILTPRSTDTGWFVVCLDFLPNFAKNGVLLDNSIYNSSGWTLAYTTSGNLWSQMWGGGSASTVYGSGGLVKDLEWQRLTFAMSNAGGAGPYCIYHIYSYETGKNAAAWAYTHTKWPTVNTTDMCIGNRQAGHAGQNGNTAFGEVRIYKNTPQYFFEHWAMAYNMGWY